MLMRWLIVRPRASRWRLVIRKTNSMIRESWNFGSTQLLGRKKGWRLSSLAWPIIESVNHANMISNTNKNDGTEAQWSFLTDKHADVLGEMRQAPGEESMKVLPIPPLSLPYASLHWLSLTVNFMINL